MSDPGELPEELLNAPVRFWMCINREHKTVTWDGNVARCPDCGVTSEMTKRYAAVLRIMLAEKIEAAERELAETDPATAESSARISATCGGLLQAARIVRGAS